MVAWNNQQIVCADSAPLWCVNARFDGFHKFPIIIDGKAYYVDIPMRQRFVLLGKLKAWANKNDITLHTSIHHGYEVASEDFPDINQSTAPSKEDLVELLKEYNLKLCTYPVPSFGIPGNEMGTFSSIDKSLFEKEMKLWEESLVYADFFEKQGVGRPRPLWWDAVESIIWHCAATGWYDAYRRMVDRIAKFLKDHPEIEEFCVEPKRAHPSYESILRTTEVALMFIRDVNEAVGRKVAKFTGETAHIICQGESVATSYDMVFGFGLAACVLHVNDSRTYFDHDQPWGMENPLQLRAGLLAPFKYKRKFIAEHDVIVRGANWLDGMKLSIRNIHTDATIITRRGPKLIANQKGPQSPVWANTLLNDRDVPQLKVAG